LAAPSDKKKNSSSVLSKAPPPPMMTVRLTMPHYANAPIIEAIIDIRVRMPTTFTFDDLKKAQAGVAADYPVAEALHESQLEMRQGPGPFDEEMQRRTMRSPIFRSEDRRRVWQSRRDGFTFSQLKPYESWKDFVVAASSAWASYREAMKPEAITRLALKYVNRFDIPEPVKELKNFLRTVPEVSPDLPEARVSGLFMQLQIPQPDLEAMLVLTEAMVPPPQVGIASVVLDIEVFRQNNLSQLDAEVWSYFDKLRERKNQVFEACITDAARELIS
jgi:uncharacterized protein (TIGR04255 family)